MDETVIPLQLQCLSLCSVIDQRSAALKLFPRTLPQPSLGLPPSRKLKKVNKLPSTSLLVPNTDGPLSTSGA